MSLTVTGRARTTAGRPGLETELPAVLLPARQQTLLSAIAVRAALAAGLLVLTTGIVYAQRGGYADEARPGQPLNLVAAAYYATITLSTIGYGDIVPVTSLARLVNIVIITPFRVVFLVVLVGTTVEVVAERTRLRMRVARWRSKLAGHTILVGYGAKGRSALSTLLLTGVPAASIVVVDAAADAVAEAARAGLAGVTGDATRREVLASARADAAARMLIAVGRDDTAVLVALTARQLNPALSIAGTVRDAENEPLLRQSGAAQVVSSADIAGRLLGLSVTDPGASEAVARLLDRDGAADQR